MQLTSLNLQYTNYHLTQANTIEFTIFRKKNGKQRTISQPSKNLKGIQAWILYNILYKLNVSKACKGFEPKTSTLQNAEPHRYSNGLLNVDIENFFPSVTRSKVFTIFRSIGYNDLISTILTNFCVIEDGLPQGSPCSPRLANLVTWKLDLRIQSYVGKHGLTYTRYADDISISGLNPLKVAKAYGMVSFIIEDEGFRLNKSKTRMAGMSKQKKVTGLVISEDNVGIGKKKANEIRSKIFQLTKSQEKGNVKLFCEVKGWLSYIKSVDIKRHGQFQKYIEKLKVKYPKEMIFWLN